MTVDWVFLGVPAKIGGVPARGASSGIRYSVVAAGTWVREDDKASVLKTAIPPCCGIHPPFGGKIKPVFEMGPSAANLRTKPDPVQVLK